MHHTQANQHILDMDWYSPGSPSGSGWTRCNGDSPNSTSVHKHTCMYNPHACMYDPHACMYDPHACAAQKMPLHSLAV